jgi:predicted phage-related endonuclease
MNAEEKASWLSARCGKLTGSKMADAMDFLKNGQSSEKRTRYIYEILAERMTGDSVNHVVTEDMLWGEDHEDDAVDCFVEMTGRDVQRSRFYDHPEIENFGATPDREIDDGLIEVKCPRTTTHLKWRLAGCVPEQHKPQMLAQLACTGRKWVGFISYDPRIKDQRLQLFMAKYIPEPEQIANIEKAARQFLSEVDKMWEQLTTCS